MNKCKACAKRRQIDLSRMSALLDEVGRSFDRLQAETKSLLNMLREMDARRNARAA